MQYSTNQSHLNEAVVAEAASYLFWMMAEEIGIRQAIDLVDETGGGCLLSLPYTKDILRQYQGFDALSDEMKSAFGQAIADLVYVTTVQQGALLSGPAHIEDAIRGRNFTAESLDFTHLNMPPKHLEIQGPFETLGTLCVRHPLPAVVFTEQPPQTQAGVIKISDTTKALGFQMPMFMTNIQGVKMDEKTYMLMGEIHIPTEDEKSARMWHHAIPNSNKFASEVKFAGQDFVGIVRPHWASQMAA